jgi:type 1 glutamine amidotransferase
MNMKKVLFIIASFFVLTGHTPGASVKTKIKTMIVTGQDGSHWWQGGSEAIKMILENSGLFTVDILVTPPWGEDMALYNPDFSAYDLVVIHYGGTTWAEPARKNFEKYVSNGGGVVVIHSSIIPMDDWETYNRIVGLGAWNGRNEKDGPYVYWKDGRFVYDYSPGWAGYHGLQHPFTVTHRKPNHPILKGLPEVWMHFKDELYARLRGPAQNMEILATAYETTGKGDEGRHEPVLWTVKYGKGKVFVTVMGHAGNDPELRYAMECTGFQVTLLRGAEWAATGQVTQKAPNDFPSENVVSLRKEFKAPFNAYTK